MFEFIVCALFIWLFVKAIDLAVRVTWGLAKAAAFILYAAAVPALIGCLLAAGGIALLIPVALVGSACCILKVCA